MITDVEGVTVGHWTDPVGLTGCTVVIPPAGTVGSCEWRGGAPGDREWVLLQPENHVDRPNAIVLSGGSAFGLAAADGVMQWLDEQGVGWPAAGGAITVPIVPAAILFDLVFGDPKARPGPREGRLACETASNGPIQCGSVGAGMGCRCGKLLGLEWAMKSGIGTASVTNGDLVVAALVAANPVGDILDEGGRVLAGTRAPAGTPEAVFHPSENTVLGVVATNAILTKQQAHLVARAGQDGVATVVRPAHTRYDGDVVFSLGTCKVEASVDLVCGLATQAVAGAIRQGARAAKGAGGIPGLAD